MATKIDVVIEAVDNLSATVKKIENNVGRMSRKIEQSTKSVAMSTKRMSDSTVKNVEKMNQSFGALSTNIRRIGALVGSFYAVRSATTALVGAAEDFKAFNEAMAYTNTIAQLTEESLENLTSEVEIMSLRLGKSAAELGRGLYDIYSSGFEGAEALDVLEVATQGAIAGLTRTDVAAKGLTAVMNAYNRKTGADAVDIMDNMFKTVDKGVITFEELASEIGSVVTASSQLGIPFDQISAAMSEMTLRGISAAESATALEGLMRSLMSPADQAKDAIKKLNEQNKELNFQWDIATLRAKGLNGIMMDLAEATQGNFEVIGEIIPNIRGMRAAMVLASHDGEGFNKMLDEQANSVGATSRALVEANKSVNRQLEQSRTEWAVYQREIGETIAMIQLNMMKSLVTFGDWADRNQEAIRKVAKAVTEVTKVFIAYKVAIFAIAKYKAFTTWLTLANSKMMVYNVATKKATVSTYALGKALKLIPSFLIISVALEGFSKVMGEISNLNDALDDLEDRADAGRKMALSLSEQARALRTSGDAELQKLTQLVNQAAILKNELAGVESEIALKGKGGAFLGSIRGTKWKEEYDGLINDRKDFARRLSELNKQIIAEQEQVGKQRVSKALSVKVGVTTPDYDDFPTLDELLGPGLDKEAKKIADTIKKINKEISEFYVDLGDLANDYADSLSDEADAFADAFLQWERYLEDIDTSLARMQASHKKTIADITDDVAKENRDFSESMDDRAKKFQKTMASMSQTHKDKVEDITHQLDLEIGMGLRADKERIKELQKDLARENRDFSQSVEERQETRELADSRERRDNTEKLADYQDRLAEEKLAYDQKSADIKRTMDRETFDFNKQQDDIREKSNETLQGLVEDYKRAFKSIYEAIRESGVPSLLAKLPEVTQEAVSASIAGVDIPRNIRAEEEFVKNWGGLYGRLPTPEEISLGAYGTTAGPNVPVEIVINNPIITNQEYLDLLTKQINDSIGEAMRLSKNGAY